jgi:hypothetical protein
MAVFNITIFTYLELPYTFFIIVQSGYCKGWGSHNAFLTYCMYLTLEGLKMTQLESKHEPFKCNIVLLHIPHSCVWLTGFILSFLEVSPTWTVCAGVDANEYGAVIGWYWQELPEVVGEKYRTQYCFVHHKSLHGSVIEPVSPWWRFAE